MNYTLTDEQQAIADLSKQLLDDLSTPARLKELEANDELVFDRELWAKLAGAGLLGLNTPASEGGSGLGPVELTFLLEQAGRTAAAVPLLATLAYGVSPIVEFGTAEQRAELLPEVVAGERVLTAALVEPLGDPLVPTTTAVPDGDGWVLDGMKTCVSAGLAADVIIVPATTPAEETGLFLVAATAPGVTRQRQETLSRVPEAVVELTGARVGPEGRLGPLDRDATTLRWLVQRATIAVAAVVTGVAEAAVRLTAEYTTTREQFDRPIATFQAVGQRAANAFIDTEAIRLTTLHAAWLLAEGRPAAKEVAVAKYFAADAGQRVVRSATHLHGGMGVDRDYPLHRYYQLAKQLELTLGGPSRQLATLGQLLANEPVTVD
jgi:alkylation response protein AidB-like acyl-CoA dehydrogenase